MHEYPLVDLVTQRPEPGHYVYRLFNSAGDLLYIGATGNIWERFGQHAWRTRNPWWDQVDFAWTVVEQVGDERCPGARRCISSEHAAMLAREVELIKGLDPQHNKNSTRYCRSGRHLMTPENTYVQPEGGRTCKECRAERWVNRPLEKRREYARNSAASRAAWGKSPEVRAKRKAHKQEPEIKARAADVQREYRARPEVRERLNAQQRARRQRPAVKVKLQKYAQRPEVRARLRDYQGKPEVRERTNAQQRRRYAERKAMKET